MSTQLKCFKRIDQISIASQQVYSSNLNQVYNDFTFVTLYRARAHHKHYELGGLNSSFTLAGLSYSGFSIFVFRHKVTSQTGGSPQREGMVARGEGCGYDGAMGEHRAPGHPRGIPHLLPAAFIFKGVGTHGGAAPHLSHLTPIYSPASAVSRDSYGFLPPTSFPPDQNPGFFPSHRSNLFTMEPSLLRQQ